MSDQFIKILKTSVFPVSLLAVLAYLWNSGRNTLALIGLFSLWVVIQVFYRFIKKVWEQELEPEAVRAGANWIRKLSRRSSRGFEKLYLKKIVSKYNLFNVKGLGLINANRLNLRDVYVELGVSGSANINRMNIDMLSQGRLIDTTTIWNFLRPTMRLPGTAYAIIGAPGSGKTTLLQHILLVAALRDRTFLKTIKRSNPIPVIIYLREIAQAVEIGSQDLPGLIDQDIRQKFPNLHIPEGRFEIWLKGGRCIVMMDGLDEVPDSTRRQSLSTWVDRQIETYNRSIFLVTSRPHGYREAPLHRAQVLEVQPLDFSAVKRFLDKWYLANEILSSGNQNTPEIRERAESETKELWDRLTMNSQLQVLTQNPLLLTMVAMVHRYHGELPGSRVQLYEEICQVLLERWRQSRGIVETLRGVQKLLVLRPLAAHLMNTHAKEIGRADVLSIMAPYLERVGIKEDRFEQFLRDLERSSGLFLEKEKGVWSLPI